MKNWQINLVLVALLILTIGIVNGTPVTVGGGWMIYNIPAGTPPVASTNNPFTYSSNGPTHIMITDLLCQGDQPQVSEGGSVLGTGSPVVSGYPECNPTTLDPDTAYAGEWSHACINMVPGRHAFDIANVQMWADSEGDGGAVKVDEGLCPGTTQAPEFPSAMLPLGMIAGIVFIVILLQKREG